jgi:hypothetical protein
LAWVVVAILLIGFGALWLAHWLIESSDSERVAASADLVGTLYSGLAFAGILYALILQRRELQLQRQELAQTRAILTQQNDTLRLQRFETSFFNLLKSHRDLVTSTQAIFTSQSSQPFVGLHAFAHVAAELTSRFSIQMSPSPSAEQLQGLADMWFAQTCYQPRAEFGHYLRSLDHLIRFVDDADIDDKWPYAMLLRAQLSNGEQLVLFFYGITSDGRGIKDYLERFHLLRGLREDPSVSHLRTIYQPRVFGETSRTTISEPPELAV